jgi:hypothetical protein
MAGRELQILGRVKMRVRLKKNCKVTSFSSDGPPEGEVQVFTKGLEGVVMDSSTYYSDFSKENKTIYHIKFDNYSKSRTMTCDGKYLDFIDPIDSKRQFVNKKGMRT